MMALALSRSLLEQEVEKKRELEKQSEILAQISSPPAATAPVLQWRPGAGQLGSSCQFPQIPVIDHCLK